jgi:hypothetical protein
MAAKDGSVNFDFWGTYVKVDPYQALEMYLGDGRNLKIDFKEIDGAVSITEMCDYEQGLASERTTAVCEARPYAG